MTHWSAAWKRNRAAPTGEIASRWLREPGWDGNIKKRELATICLFAGININEKSIRYPAVCVLSRQIVTNTRKAGARTPPVALMPSGPSGDG